MRVYTGGGDKGQTSLFSGERVPKHHIRIESYGDIDELSSILGGIAATLPESETEIREDILNIQTDLFNASGWLATTPESSAVKFLTPLSEKYIDDLEEKIDSLSAELPVLKEFILPGGHQSAVWAHLARTVCRRCERRATQLELEFQETEDQNLKLILIYLNRLSDYLFVLARYLNKVAGVADVLSRQK